MQFIISSSFSSSSIMLSMRYISGSIHSAIVLKLKSNLTGQFRALYAQSQGQSSSLSLSG
jgi:hypothetical protein